MRPRWQQRPSRGGWSVARLQRIGNWGRADEALGRRWEEVGLAALSPLLHKSRRIGTRSYVPIEVLPLADDEALRQEVHRSGLPNPDACLLGTAADGSAVLQPVDFKWSLERARLPQVGASTIQRLLEADLPAVQARLAAARVAAGLADLDLQCADGFFFAPEHPENRDYLASPANARAEFPLTPADVVCWSVDPRGFFASLDGWELGGWLARVDRSQGLLDTIDGAERYFRLGAGFAGALRRLATPLFGSAPAAVDAKAELERLRAVHRLATSAQVATHLERLMAVRDEHEQRLRGLEAALYPFRQLRHDLARSVGQPEATSDGPIPGLRQHYRVAQAAVRVWLRREGQALTQRGYSEAAALDALHARAPELTPTAHTIALRALAAADRASTT
jgi:hypothetical protein